MKSEKLPDQFAARCCWVNATRLLTKSPWRSVSSVRFDMLPLHERCLRLLYSKGVPGLAIRGAKALDIRKNKLLLRHPKRISGAPGASTPFLLLFARFSQ